MHFRLSRRNWDEEEINKHLKRMRMSRGISGKETATLWKMEKGK